MMSNGLPGERFARNFHTDDPAIPIVTGLEKGYFAAARIVHSGVEHGIAKIPSQDAFVLAYLLKDFSKSEMWVGGRAAKWDPIRPGQTHFYNLERDIQANIREPLDFVYMYLPRRGLDEFTDEQELSRIDGSSIHSGAAFADPVAAQLACSLLPILKRSGQANQLLIDQVAFTLQSHFVRRYARVRGRRAFFRGGLTPSQERRAKELIRFHIAGTISVDQLAHECGLSRSQFFRAFRRSTGKTPHRWLVQSRVELSKEMLLASRMSLTEIAGACGFANPSHFTRVFSTYVGVAPGIWRAAQRR